MIEAAIIVAMFATPEAPPSATTMARIVVRDVSESLPATSFQRRPKTTFRLGACCLRVEEELDSAAGLHLLVIVNEPDAWMINRVDGKADHFIDRGPTFNAHAPIDEGLKELEVGEELAFMKAHNASAEGPFACAAGSCERYAAAVAGYQVILVTAVSDKRPIEIRIQPVGKPERRLLYDAYETDLPPDAGLFRPPQGVTVRDRQ